MLTKHFSIFFFVIATLFIPTMVFAHGDTVGLFKDYLEKRYQSLIHDAPIEVRLIEEKYLRPIVDTVHVNRQQYRKELRFPQASTVQAFLEQQPGSLKKYKLSNGISDACEDGMGIVDCRMFLTILELKTGAIQNSRVTLEDVDRSLSSISEFEERNNEPLKSRVEHHFNDLGWLFIQAEYEFRFIVDKNRLLVRLPDGEFRKLSSNVDEETYIIERVMSQVASSMDEWERWNNDEVESFFHTYTFFFAKHDDLPSTLFFSMNNFFKKNIVGIVNNQRLRQLTLIVFIFLSLTIILCFFISFKKK